MEIVYGLIRLEEGELQDNINLIVEIDNYEIPDNDTVYIFNCLSSDGAAMCTIFSRHSAGTKEQDIVCKRAVLKNDL